MPLLIDTEPNPRKRRRAADCIEIGLVNNMPDAALKATERQFIALMAAAAGDMVVRLRLLTLPGVPRSERAQGHLRESYCDIDEVMDGALDAVVVTGAEPRAAALSGEPYWPALAALIDWAEHNTLSSIWSCLAAHAAVHRLDGIVRRPLAAKCFGVFECATVAEHPLTAGLAPQFTVPHSRWNALSEDDLGACGYTVLSRSEQAGVDAFARQGHSLFLFFQGHPEYDSATLLGEYRRDVARFLRRETEICPPVPRGYFDPATAESLRRLSARATADRLEDLLAEYPLTGAALRDDWRPAALILYRNWLATIAARKQRAVISGWASAAASLEPAPACPPAANPAAATARFVERRRRDDSAGGFTGECERRLAARG